MEMGGRGKPCRLRQSSVGCCIPGPAELWTTPRMLVPAGSSQDTAKGLCS